ncbi:unannotated protein [freshwater metagenome]|uniref:Unannotated protein n=1 Tax=freshwater metagenome TaxID=449393 RepID=A0A6J7RRV0_9ZZZZ
MHMHFWNSVFHCTRDIDVVVAIEIGVNTTLQGDFCSAHFPSLCGTLCNVVEREQIRGATQVEAEWAFRKTTELALERAYVGVVDVAVVHPGDGVANSALAQVVGKFGNGVHFAPASAEQCNNLLLVGEVSGFNAIKNFTQLSRNFSSTRNQDRWLVVGTGVPLC